MNVLHFVPATNIRNEPSLNQICFRLNQLVELYPKHLVRWYALTSRITFIIDLYALFVLRMNLTKLLELKMHVDNLRTRWNDELMYEATKIAFADTKGFVRP